MSLSLAIAERLLAIRPDAIPPDTVDQATIAIFDTVGVILAGAAEPTCIAATRLAAPGDATLFGRPGRVHPADAAEINGIAAHILDYDCVADTMAGHPTVQLVPALFALAEGLDCTGTAFIAATIAGLETQARIAKGIAPPLGRAGWFSTSVLGVFGAAAGCAHLMGLDAAATANALGIAANCASGLLGNAGSDAKSLAAGHAASCGMRAAQLAAVGITAAPDVFEHRQGFFAAFNPSGQTNQAAMLEDWGHPFDVAEPGLWIKQYPCCGIAHAPIDLLLALKAAHGFGVADVSGITVRLHPQRLAHVDRPNPQTPTQAAFSIQYCLARALATGAPTLADFTPDAFRNPAIAETMRRVTAAIDPAMDAASTNYGEQFGASLTVATCDGHRFSASAATPTGHSPRNPLPDATLAAKFHRCATRVLSQSAAAALAEALRDLRNARSLREVTALAGAA